MPSPSYQTQRLRESEDRYLAQTKLIRELRMENEKLKAKLKRLRANMSKPAKPGTLTELIRKAEEESVGS